jgi:aspartyl-tRNA(Asn)/glutamyl-tRNA(Gln) amidotransferase subunit A
VTIQQAARALRERRISARELTASAIDRIDRLNGRLKAFITPTAESARLEAEQADAEIAAGRIRGPLHGIPVAYKDLFYTRGIRTTHGSLPYENFVPSYNATVVDRLTAAGVISLGKLNMHEMAYGITSDNPHYGTVRNPWKESHSPGGSSGGSGAAVASGIVYAAMGSDTGGSIRIPASFCGVAGLKPTYGRVSRYGALPCAYSLDHVGPLARSVRDCALILNATAGYDPQDTSSSRRPVMNYVPEEGCSIRGMRVGVAENFFFENLDGQVEAAVRGAIARAEALGAEIKPVRLPDPAGMNAVARVIQMPEAAAAAEPHLEHRHRFSAEVMTLLDQGRLIPAMDYVNAQRLRRRMGREFARLWTEVDCLITPTTPTAAPRIGQTVLEMGGRQHDVRLATTGFMRLANLLGIPALSMPCGLTSEGLPVGLQIMGPLFQEALVLRVGAALEDSGITIPACPLE